MNPLPSNSTERPLLIVNPWVERTLAQVSGTGTKNNDILLPCRFCGEEKSHEELLDLSEEETTLHEYFEKLEFLKIDYIDLSNGLLPKTTCESCYNAFDDAFEFFKKVKQAQIHLDVLINAKIKVEIEESENSLNSGEGEYEETNYEIAKSVDTCEDHMVAFKTESFPIKNEESLFNPTAQTDVTQKVHKSKKKATKVVDDNMLESQEVPFIITKNPDKRTAILQADKLTPILIKTEKGNVSIKLSDLSTCQDGITSVQNNATNITELKTEMNLMYKEVTTIDVNHDNTTNTSMSNNVKKIKSEPVADLAVQSKNALMRDINKYTQVISWKFYTWFCLHCKERFYDMNELRNHSKYVHNTCFGFKCADCPERFRRYNQFVEHVREHYASLRLYCQYCNCEFKSAEQCVTHTFSHWKDTTICEFCGEILPNFEVLHRHKRAYRKIKRASIDIKIPKIVHSTGSWDDYDWSCQDCWMEMPDASSARTHAQDVHNKCFSMRCVDCLLVVQDYVQFVNHVKKHRPYLGNYCQFCNMYIEEEHKLNDHVNKHCHICYTCGHVFANNTELFQHIEQYNVRKVKGVGQAVNTNSTCDMCQKTFSSPYSLKLHMVNMHKKKRRRDFTCQTCGKGYETISALRYHTYKHNDKTEKCKLCGKMFKSGYSLKNHAKTHLQDRPKFICDICGQSFFRKYAIQNHILGRHENIKKSNECLVCNKAFRTKQQLKSHERQHTGVKPYTCKVCKRSFACWGNCNKHMIRKHGVTLAKTKNTARGKLDIINSETGEARNLALDKNAEEWLKDLTKPQKIKRFPF